MYYNILSAEQKALLPLVTLFHKSYYLVGGTAIALQIGHRQSIDFDMFTDKKVQKKRILEQLQTHKLSHQLLFADSDSIHFLVEEVKLTFFQYPFKVPTALSFEQLKMPNLLNLAAMKAYALGRRSKWKDYVDLYFILKTFHTFEQISQRASEIFGELFSPKLFKMQLCYFQDIDYTEEVFYMPNCSISNIEIQSFLTNLVTNNEI